MQPDRVDSITLARIRRQLHRSPEPARAERAAPPVTCLCLRRPDQDETALSPAEITIGIRIGVIAHGAAA